MFRSRAHGVLTVFIAMSMSACGGGGGGGGTASNSQLSAPLVTFKANQTSVVTGQAVVLSWSTSGASTCTASSGWTGTRETSGSESATASAAGSVSYTLTCQNTSGSTARTVTITAAPAVVSGKLFAPDGATPVAGARVYAATTPTLSALRPNRKANPLSSDCAPPALAALASACTAADGSFSFTVDSVSSDTFSLVAEKGMFRLAQAVPVAVATDAGNLKLPKDVSAGAPRIALVTGNYGCIDRVLAKLGLATLNLNSGNIDVSTASFAMFSGFIQIQPGPFRYDLPDVATLFAINAGTGLPKLQEFDIIIVDSGANTTVLANATNRAALRTYVEKGGVLFVLDRAIDFIEQTMPEYLRAVGATDTNPQTPDAYYAGLEGPSGVAIDASTDDALLVPWLKGVSCLGGACVNQDNTIRMDRLDEAWVVLEGAHSVHASDVHVTTRGVVALTATTQERPLSVMFKVGQGQVIFSSFGSVFDDVVSDGLYAQERALQYLMLAAGE